MEQAEDYEDMPPPAREGQDAETAVWAPMEEYCAACNPNPHPPPRDAQLSYSARQPHCRTGG
eukprot:3427705-Pyramimonas_sp.AAC.1